ncbi:MAG: hypothetical protein HYW77_02530 [Parcubacteria group bacterium]|nr:hypothetical protein [Parcubacteria group bacterium]
MANIMVAGDLYQELDGQLWEIKRQMRQPSGYPFDPFQLKVHLQFAIEGRFGPIVATFKRDMRKEGWTLLESVPHRIFSAVDGISFLKEGETYVNGEEMVLRARREFNANYGQEDAEWLLENQSKISKELRKYYLVFPGTIWQGSDGRWYVPYLHWRVGGWVLRFYRLGRAWHSRDRLVVPRK